MKSDSNKSKTVAEAKSEATLAAPSGSASPCDQPCQKCGNRNPKRQWRFRGCEMEHPLGHPETEAMLASGKIREVIYNQCQCGWSWETPVLSRVSETGAAC
jgi:hypothetical protein